MSALTMRGMLPHPRTFVATTTGRRLGLPAPLAYLQVSNLGDYECRLYFQESDYTNDVNYVTVRGEWEGPVETEHASAPERSALWFKGVGGTVEIEAVLYARRG